MLQQERANDPQEALRAALDGRQAQIWTALPGIIESFDAEKGTCKVQPAIQAKVRAKDGTISDVKLPVLVDCPVVFPHGGGWTMTFPLAEGDECLVVFASRCIDSWWESGGVQVQAELRMHDLSDGFIIPGPCSKGKVPSSVSTDQVELRNADGTLSLSTTATGFKIKGNLEVTGGLDIQNVDSIAEPMKIKGNIKQEDGNFETDGGVQAATVTAGGIDLATHVHSGVQTGGGNSGPPVP